MEFSGCTNGLEIRINNLLYLTILNYLAFYTFQCTDDYPNTIYKLPNL